MNSRTIELSISADSVYNQMADSIEQLLYAWKVVGDGERITDLKFEAKTIPLKVTFESTKEV